MAAQSPPFALQNGSHSAALFRQAASSPWITGGILVPGELAVAAQSTPNMSVQVAGGRAWITGTQVANVTGQSFSTQGAYFGLNDAPATVTIAAANATNPRIDVVYAAVQDSFYSGATNVLVLGVVTGTPAASPVAPAAPSNALTLATVAVAANATSITNGNITTTATASLLAIARGGVDPVLSTGRPTTGLYPGYSIYETDTGRRYVYSGTAWVYAGGAPGPITAVSSIGTGYTAGTGFAPGVYKDGSGQVHVIGGVTNNTIYTPSSNTMFTLPTGFRPSKDIAIEVMQATGWAVGGVYAADGTVKINVGPSLAAGTLHTLNFSFHPGFVGGALA